MKRRIQRIHARSRRSWRWANHQTGGWLGVIFDASFEVLLGYEAYITAAAIAFFAFFSLFPLILLSVVLASPWLDAQVVELELVNQLEFVAPDLRVLLGKNLEQIIRSRQSMTGFALLTLLWSASTIFYVITQSLDQIWQVAGHHPAWRKRGIALLLAMSISALLLLFAHTILAAINSLVPETILHRYTDFNFFLAVGLNIVLFLVLYRFLPHIYLTWQDVFPGAVLGGLMWEFAKGAFRLFVANYLSQTNLVYGSVAAIIAFLTWAYFSSIIFLFGAYINAGYYDLRHNKKRKGK